MKLFKKLMAGVMAVAMLSAYTVALADELEEPAVDPNQKTETVTGAGSYAGNAAPRFVVEMPTAATVGSKLSFIVDPNKMLDSSKPADATTDSTFDTVIFKKTIPAVDGGAAEHQAYATESDELKITSKSSVDVTVNMLASVSDTKMTLSSSDTFTAAKEHLYLAVKVNDGTETVAPVTALGAKKATTLASVPGNFTISIGEGGTFTTSERALAEGETELTGWKDVTYKVTGKSNPAADWDIEDIAAPTLTIKWVIDPANVITTALTDPVDAAPADYDADANGPYAATWTALLDKAAYKAGETVTLYVKPTDATKKVKTVAFEYVSLSTKAPVTDKKVTVKATIGETIVNGVYSATFALPSNMAKSDTPTGTADTAVAYTAPTFAVTLG